MIEISNSLGQLVMSKEINASEISIDTRSFQKGFYFVKISSGEINTVKKFVKD